MKHLRLLPVLLLFAACTTQSVLDESFRYYSLADYEHAYRVLADARREQMVNGGTVDPELEKAYQRALREVMIDRARSSIFAEREDDALVTLDQLEKIAPGFPGLDDLRSWAVWKKARRLAGKGDEFLARKDFTNAMTDYLEAEKLCPGLPETQEGMKAVRERMVSMSVRAQQEFLEALRKLPEFRYLEVQWHTSNVILNEPEREDARELGDKARHETALRAIERARTAAKAEQYGAALVEYKEGQRLDPNIPGIDAEIAQVKKEINVLILIERAQREMRSGRFDAARELLADAFKSSVMTRGHVSEMQIEVRKLEGESRYRTARDFELLGKKSEALAAFEAIKKEWPEGVSDEAARVDSLRVDIDGAAAEWKLAEEAEAAGNLQAALDHYLNSQAYYASWKDAASQVERLRTAIAAKAGDGSATGG